MAPMSADETEDYENILKAIWNNIFGVKSKIVRNDVIFAVVMGCSLGACFWRFDLEMSKEAWFYVFSTLSQTLAAFIAFGAMFLVYCLTITNTPHRRQELIAELNIPYSLLIASTVLSIILLTFGQTNIPQNLATDDLFKFFKYFISFFTIALGIFGMVRTGGMIWLSRMSPQ